MKYSSTHYIGEHELEIDGCLFFLEFTSGFLTHYDDGIPYYSVDFTTMDFDICDMFDVEGETMHEATEEQKQAIWKWIDENHNELNEIMQ